MTQATDARYRTAVAGPVEPTVRPCPFCGSTNGTDQMGETYRWRLWQCSDCGAKGPEVRCQISGAGRGGEAEARLVAVFEDRDRMVKMWRAAGVPCFQVAEGEF